MRFQENSTPAEASQIIKDALSGITNGSWNNTVQISIRDSVGKILAAPIIADRPQPPFHRIAMDGIVIKSERFLVGKRKFLIGGIQKAGDRECQFSIQDGFLSNGNSSEFNSSETDFCMEVMTGAVLPIGADCVIPFEGLKIENGFAIVTDEKFLASPYKNIHQKAKSSLLYPEILHRYWFVFIGMCCLHFD